MRSNNQESPSERTSGPVHTRFSLSYANYLVLHRTLMQSMPVEWQRRMVRCLEELDAAFGHVERPGSFDVTAGEERYLDELTPDEAAQVGYTIEVGEHETRYYDRQGWDVTDDCVRVLVPASDPVPYYRFSYVEPDETAIRAIRGDRD
ncbi:hypothetical protein AB0L88_44395 [Saccharopolyspora shandongensis]|uniref:hypothetical protein n=1 Tax=Saccharopolyspora shandongensis TaxID=418495 RepID=UPI0034397AAD